MKHLLRKKLAISAILGGFLTACVLAFFYRQGLMGSASPRRASVSGNFFTRLTESWGLSRRNIPNIYQVVVTNKTWMGQNMLLDREPHLYFWQEADIGYFSKKISSGGLNITALAGFPMTDYAQEWEWEFLDYPTLTDPLSAANETQSRVVIVGKSSGFRVNDNLTLRVDVHDGRGRPLHRGGDEVRIWVVDRANNASMATEVVDLGNGSYWAVVPLLWPGMMDIRAAITYNKEFMRAIYFVRNAIKSLKYPAAGFTSSFGSAATLCSPFPFIPGHQELCSFTKENGGLSWFCGKPRNPALGCKHWTHIGDLPFVDPLPVTEAEAEWNRWLQKPSYFRVIPSGTNINVAIGKSLPATSISSKPHCKLRRRAHSWTETAPRGYLMGSTWVPRRCTMPILKVPQVSSCLKDTTVLLLGDSNLRLTLSILMELTGCILDTPTGTLKPKWHKPVKCVNPTTNTEIRWRTHELPFHIGSPKGDRMDQKAASEYIDEIPPEGKFLVVVHLYLHFTPHHYSVFASHVRAVVAAVHRLLLRNPAATVVIRGPHQALQHWPPLQGGCAQGRLYTDIIKTEFRSLYDKVLFLQPWDMTVAAENREFHPPDYVNKAINTWMLAHICD